MNFLISSMATARSTLPPGAGLFAAAVADVAADGGEGVLFFDELERIHVAAFGCHADIALNGNVCRTVALAGGCAVS